MRKLSLLLLLPAFLGGCSYVHFGRLPSDSELAAENARLVAANKLLEPQLTALRAEYAKLQAQRDRLLQTPADAADPAGQLQLLKVQLSDTEDKLATALKSYAAVETENAQLNTELLQQKDAVSRAEQQTSALRGDLATANQRIATLTAARTGATTSNATTMTTPAPAPTARFETTAEAARNRAVTPVRPGVTPLDLSTPGVRTHVIVAGDTLGKISQRYYGTTERWREILAANAELLRDEKSLVIGRTLRIP